jgi:outer membrane immunogenic protein
MPWYRVGIAFLATAIVGLVGMSAGSAADLGSPAYKAPPPLPPAAPPFSWTGFYIGGNIGAGWGTSDTTLIASPALGLGLAGNLPFGTLSPSGILGGAQVGYNWQSDWLVLGVEGDFDAAAIRANSSCTNGTVFATMACSTNTSWLASASGRVGGVVGERMLAYVKGGGAWKETKYSATDTFGAFLPAGTSVSSSAVRTGWLLGLGLEYAFAPHWTGSVEYDYMDFGSQNVIFTTTGFSVPASLDDKLSEVKMGLNYKF